MVISRESVIVENIHLVCLLDLKADFGEKTNAKLSSICQLREKSKTGIQSCLFTVTVLRTFPDVCIFSNIQLLWSYPKKTKEVGIYKKELFDFDRGKKARFKKKKEKF